MSRTAAPPAPGKVPTYAPNQTLYITNLPSSKIQKEDLRRALYMLFSSYGPVLDVVALRTTKMRGQAHVVYRDIQTATQAMRALQGFEFFDREMQIQYAKSKSDAIARLDGTFTMPAPAAGEVTATELQQSIFNAPPAVSAASTTNAATTTTAYQAPMQSLKVPEVKDGVVEGSRSPSGSSVAGKKRAREEEDDDSGSDVAMEEDSDDE